MEIILKALLDKNWNINRDFGNLFNKIYLDLLGNIKTSLYELFYNRNDLNISENLDENGNSNKIKYYLNFCIY